MTSRSHPARSVRFTLLFWNVGILALALLGFSTVFRTLVQIRLRSVLDKQLIAGTQNVVHGWETMDPTQRAFLRVQAHRYHLGVSILALIGKTPSASTHEPDRSYDPLAPAYQPRVLTPDGKEDYATGDPQTPLDARTFAAAARGETVLSTVQIAGKPARVLSLPIRIDGKVDGVVQVARDLGEYQRELQGVSNDLLAAIPFLLLVSAVGGQILTNRALLPVRALREAAERIEAEDLSLRLELSRDDEFAQLADTFNHMLARLERAFAQQARFTADASHELRTPLTVLLGNTSLALARDRSAEEYRETVVRAHRTAESMNRLIDELLLLSQADAAQIQMKPECVRLAETLHAAIDATTGRDALPIALVAPDPAICVQGNPAMLVRLFANLLGNAVRHTPPDRLITVTVLPDRDSVTVTVQDAGEGIPPEHLPYVRDRFYRVDPARAPHGGGSGLGLAICQSIVDAHNGTLALQSEVGVGTTVLVTLPSAQNL